MSECVLKSILAVTLMNDPISEKDGFTLPPESARPTSDSNGSEKYGSRRSVSMSRIRRPIAPAARFMKPPHSPIRMAVASSAAEWSKPSVPTSSRRTGRPLCATRSRNESR